MKNSGRFKKKIAKLGLFTYMTLLNWKTMGCHDLQNLYVTIKSNYS